MATEIFIGMLLAFLGQAFVNLGLVLQKHGATRLPAIETTTMRANVKGFLTSGTWSLGIIVTGIGGLLNFMALSFAPLLVVQSFLAIGLALIPFFSKVLLKEELEMEEVFMILVTVSGIVLLFYSLLDARLIIVDEQLLFQRLFTVDSLAFHGILLLSIIIALASLSVGKSNSGVFWGFFAGCSAGYAQILTRPFAVFFFRDLLTSLTSALFWGLLSIIAMLQVVSIVVLQLGFQKSRTSKVAVPYNVLAFLVPFFGSIFLLQEWKFTTMYQPIGISMGVILTLIGVSRLAQRASVVPLPSPNLELVE